MRVGVGENCGAELCGLRNYLDFLDGQAERLEVRLLLPERNGPRAARAALRGRHERRCQRTEEWRTRPASSRELAYSRYFLR